MRFQRSGKLITVLQKWNDFNYKYFTIKIISTNFQNSNKNHHLLRLYHFPGIYTLHHKPSQHVIVVISIVQLKKSVRECITCLGSHSSKVNETRTHTQRSPDIKTVLLKNQCNAPKTSKKKKKKTGLLLLHYDILIKKKDRITFSLSGICPKTITA